MSYDTAEQLRDRQGQYLKNQYYDSVSDTYKPGSNPGGGGGGGGGDASAANQTAVIGSKAGGTAATSSQLVGAVYNTTPPTLTNGQQAAVQLNNVGSMAVTLRGSSTTAGLDITGGTGTDGYTGSGGKVTTLSIMHAYNGTTYDRLRGDTIGLRVTPSTSTGTDRSTTVGTTSAAVMATNASRRGFIVQNTDIRDIYYNYGATAVVVAGSGNFVLRPGETLMFIVGHIPSESINMIVAAGTASISAREW